MKVGDLVVLKKGSCGVVIEVHGPTIMFAYEVVTVVFSDGTLMEGIPSRWFGVINESGRFGDSFI